MGNQDTRLLIFIVSFLGLLCFSALGLAAFYGVEYYRNEQVITNMALIYSLDVASADEYSNLAKDYYTKASLAYEQQEWDSVVMNCEIARDKYAKSSQEYKELRATIEDIEVEFIQTYAEMLRLNSEIDTNMYEACEHFESASRYYKKYYLPSTPASDISFDMGSAEIESMNEKIRQHDSNVEEYNTLLARYNQQTAEYLLA